MEKMRIAVPTKTHAGLEDLISEVFGKAITFTIVDIENGKIKNVQVIDNPVASLEHGAGPVAVKTLADLKINLVIAGELGLGVSSLLEHYEINSLLIETNTKVEDSIKEALSILKIEQT